MNSKKKAYISVAAIVLCVLCMASIIIYRINKDSIADISGYSFSTDKITIVFGSDKKKIEITDKATIEEITDLCKEDSFKTVKNGYDGLCEIWLDFNNGTIIGMYDDMDYGYIGNAMEAVLPPDLYLPKGLNEKTNELIQKYTD